MFIVSESERFSKALEANDGHMRELQETVNDLKVNLKGLEIVLQQIANLRKDFQTSESDLSALKHFKTRAVAISSTVWAVLSVALVIMGVFLGLGS